MPQEMKRMNVHKDQAADKHGSSGPQKAGRLYLQSKVKLGNTLLVGLIEGDRHFSRARCLAKLHE